MKGNGTKDCNVTLNIMRRSVEVVVDETSKRIEGSSLPDHRLSNFLRVLALESVHSKERACVPYDELIEILDVNRKNDVHRVKHAADKILVGRRPKLIETVSGRGYYLNADHLDLDISRVHDVVDVWEANHSRWFTQIGGKPSQRQLDAARSKRNEMDEALAQWKANPAEPLKDFVDQSGKQRYRPVYEYFKLAEDDVCRTHAISTILTCEQLTRIESPKITHEDRKRVTTALERMEYVRSRPGFDEALLVMLSCLGDEKWAARGYLKEAKKARNDSNKAAVRTAERYYESYQSRQDKVRSWTEALGIVPVHETDQNTDKKHNRFPPSQCIRMTQSTLFVSGVFVRSWVLDRHTIEELEELCDRLDKLASNESDSSVRFLILDPTDDGFQRFEELPNAEIPDPWTTVEALQQLDQKYKSFEARAFNSIPIFRTIVIDSKIVLFSPYKLNDEQFDPSTGSWYAPQFWLETEDVEWPLSDSFKTLFNETWISSRKIAEIEIPSQ